MAKGAELGAGSRFLIELHAADLGYRSGEPVLRGVELLLSPGQWVGLVGPNGSGKSTLLRVLAGGLKPLTGKLVRRKLRVAYVPQAAAIDPLYPFSVRDLVAQGDLLRRRYAKRAELRVAIARALERVGLGSFESKAFADLSGGQRQRVLVARALLREPELMLLDEPTSGVDVQAADDLLAEIRGLSQETGCAVVLATHQLPWLAARPEPIWCVRRGSLEGHPAGALSDPALLQSLFAEG